MCITSLYCRICTKYISLFCVSRLSVHPNAIGLLLGCCWIFGWLLLLLLLLLLFIFFKYCFVVCFVVVVFFCVFFWGGVYWGYLNNCNLFSNRPKLLLIICFNKTLVEDITCSDNGATHSPSHI